MGTDPREWEGGREERNGREEPVDSGKGQTRWAFIHGLLGLRGRAFPRCPALWEAES